MTWFKVDDGFYDHPKVLGLPLAAVGLWTLAGAYCARHLTDGVITDKQIRAIGGTRAQAEKLVAAGLWSSDGAPPASRSYSFHDWRAFQPTRADVEEKRAIDRERKAEARARKAAKQAIRENVRADNGGTSARTSTRTAHGFQKMSALPDPTRPDPTYLEGEVVSKGEVVGGHNDPPSIDDLAAAHAAASAGADRDDGGDGRGGDTATPDEWSSAADPRCREHADLDRAEVPPCRACAAAREWFEEKVAAAWRAHRAAINDCDICDDRGLVDTTGTDGTPVAVRCDHTTRPNPRPAATHTSHQPVSDPDTRRELLNRFKRPGGPF